MRIISTYACLNVYIQHVLLPCYQIILNVDIFLFTEKVVTTNSIIKTRTIELHRRWSTMYAGLCVFALNHRISP